MLIALAFYLGVGAGLAYATWLDDPILQLGPWWQIAAGAVVVMVLWLPMAIAANFLSAQL
jgi:hypothetical protein